jgi:hypothetical protein
MKLLQPLDEERTTIVNMLIAIFFMRLFEVMFFLGVAGSVVVVAISFVEDLQLLVGE